MLHTISSQAQAPTAQFSPQPPFGSFHHNTPCGDAARAEDGPDPAIGIRPAHYSGPATDPAIEALTRRAYTRRRSRLVDRWIQYADAEGFGQGGVA
jgi:hypothetical protein